MYNLHWSQQALEVRPFFLGERNVPAIAIESHKRIGPVEKKLINEINKKLPDSQKFKDLRRKMTHGELTKSENREFVRIAESRELANANRAKAVMELAKLRNVPFSELWKELVGVPQE